ncbi:MAG: Ig-like domain-containing protein [Bacteroidota bacterium]
MLKSTTPLLLSILFLMTFSFNLFAQSNVKYGPDYIVFEAEDTDSPLGDKWVIKTPNNSDYLEYLLFPGDSPEPVNDTYFQYVGPWMGANSELEYHFTCPKTGTYNIAMRMLCPLLPGEGHDQKNDFFIKLEGNFTSGSPSHTDNDLQTFHKLFGRGPNQWGTCLNLEHNGLHGVFYNLIEGEEYVFHLKGRSSKAIIDYITFYQADYLNHNIGLQSTDLALLLPEEIRPYEELLDIAVDPTDKELRVGTSSQLFVFPTPSNANPNVSWVSSDESVVLVNEEGEITSAGTVGQTATITATSTIDNSMVATANVELVEWFPISVDSIAIVSNEALIVEGESTQLTATIFPLDADEQTVIWSSSDMTIATVDQSGEVTGISDGAVEITATSAENNSIFAKKTLEVGAFFAQYVDFDDDDKYLQTTYSNQDSMEVIFSYHAGSLSQIQSLKLFLREIRPNWSVANDVVINFSQQLQGTVTDTITAKIPLTGLTPTANLSTGHFYFLFLNSENTNGIPVEKGIYPIIIEQGPTSTNESYPYSDKITIYPNPTTDVLFVDTQELPHSEVSIHIFDSVGRLIQVSSGKEDTLREISTTNFKAGYYTIRLLDGETVLAVKSFVKN